MKKTFIATLTILCISIYSFGQDKNENLYQSIVKNDKEKVKQLLSEKADANYIKSSGEWMKVNMLITAINNNNIDIVKILIEHKADINWKDGFNTTALMYGASKGNQEIVALLIENGADINASDGQGNTVLSVAKESKNNGLVKFIMDKQKVAK